MQDTTQDGMPETMSETMAETMPEMTAADVANAIPLAPETPPPEPALSEAEGALPQGVSLGAAKVATLRAILKSVQVSLDNAVKLLGEDELAAAQAIAEAADQTASLVQSSFMSAQASAPRPFLEAGPDDRVVEGVFDGERMIGSDGKGYPVPPNYASKSKLVEGDLLKLTIGDRGNFIFKQIGPIDRQRIVGALSYDQAAGQFIVLAAGRTWRVLKASVTYFKGEAGDEAVILVPKNAPSRWAAVENVIKRNPLLRP